VVDAKDEAKESDPTDMHLKAPHFSTKGVGAFIRFLDAREGTEVIDGALRDAGLPREYVMAEDLWVSHDWQRRFQRALAGRLYQLAELPPHDHPFWQLWREGGHAAYSREALGPLYDVVRTLGSPALAYRQLPSLMALYNRHTEVSFESLGASTHRLVFSQVDASQSIDPALYWNILGTIERLPIIWDLPDARIDEEEGPFNSDAPSRRLVIKLRHSNPEKVRWGFRVLGGLAGGIVGALTGSLTS
jgi:hypothetical protein